MATIDRELVSNTGSNVYKIQFNSFSDYGNIDVFANNTGSGESAGNELSHLKPALFTF